MYREEIEVVTIDVMHSIKKKKKLASERRTRERARGRKKPTTSLIKHSLVFYRDFFTLAEETNGELLEYRKQSTTMNNDRLTNEPIINDGQISKGRKILQRLFGHLRAPSVVYSDELKQYSINGSYVKHNRQRVTTKK